MTVWFTADTHWGHANILGYSKRPFDSIEEMNERLIENWNGLVHRGDTVYHLGDIAFWNDRDVVEKLVKRLNGGIHLIYGNHDFKAVKRCRYFVWQGDLKYARIYGQRVMMCHYAMRVWRGAHHGAWMLYGHSHNSLDENWGKSMDVGVDCWSYHPISFDQVKELMDQCPIVMRDYHRNLLKEGTDGNQSTESN